MRVSKERVERLEGVIEEFVPAWSLAPIVWALQRLRGVDLIVAVTFVTEVGDASRFESPRQLMDISVWFPASAQPGDSPARRHHKGRQRSGSPHVGRERLDLSTSAQGREATVETVF